MERQQHHSAMSLSTTEATVEAMKAKRALRLMELTMDNVAAVSRRYDDDNNYNSVSYTDSDTDSVLSENTIEMMKYFSSERPKTSEQRHIQQQHDNKMVQLPAEKVAAFKNRLAKLEQLVEKQEEELARTKHSIEKQVEERVAAERRKKEPVRFSFASNYRYSDLQSQSKEELLGVLEMVNEHMESQKNQMEAAKLLIESAITARDSANKDATEAIKLALILDAQLEESKLEVQQLRESSSSTARSSSSSSSSSRNSAAAASPVAAIQKTKDAPSSVSSRTPHREERRY